MRRRSLIVDRSTPLTFWRFLAPGQARTILRSFLKSMHILPLIHHLKAKYYRLIGRRQLVKVPLDRLRCQRRSYSELLGFSGEMIDCFPPCRFFEESLTERAKAQDDFCQWLHECLVDKQAYEVPTAEGGWANSTLVREIEQVHREHGISLTDIERADPALLGVAINRQVSHYFEVLDSIREQGYDTSYYPPIYCRPENGMYRIQNGHHRVSALWALGYQEASVMIRRA